MVLGNRTTAARVALTASLVVGLAATGLAQRGNQPLDWLMRALEPAPRVPATLIQALYGDGRRGMVQLKFQSDGQGRTRRTILQPLSQQGVVQTDDGSAWVTYFPDKREVMEQPSPVRWQLRPDRRAALLARNYRVTFGESGRIAGRVTIQVIARPNDRDLPVRIFDLDQRTSVLLRSSILAAGAEAPQVQMETLAASFPARIEPGFYQRPDGPAWRELTCEGPTRLDRVPELGFEPVIPERLPRGFSVLHVHRMGERDAPFVGIRLTDGLASTTVYQWLTSNPPNKLPFRGRRGEVNGDGIAFRVVGSLPRAVEADLLSAFLRSRKDLRSYFGTEWFDLVVDTYISPRIEVIPETLQP